VNHIVRNDWTGAPRRAGVAERWNRPVALRKVRVGVENRADPGGVATPPRRRLTMTPTAPGARHGALVLLLLLFAGCDRAGPAAGAGEAPRACPPLPAASMRWVPAGTFVMGADPRYPEEGPPRAVTLPGFWMDVHELTNGEFAAFVRVTGYRTVAERDPPAPPGAPPDMRKPGSAVFSLPSGDDPRWWRWVVGASWRHPEGPGSSVAGRDREPVVQIAYADALAYARWAGKTLPTEAQWEYAALGGKPPQPEPLSPDGEPTANTYQGPFPRQDLALDGFRGRAPAGCFPPNGYGLYDMIGNVWEWTQDAAGGRSDTGVIKGGSFLCAANYCARYRPAARQFQERGLGTDHIGVRFIDSRRPPPAVGADGLGIVTQAR
jgi:formylglycine-generating enzyme required for sulfatase activity